MFAMVVNDLEMVAYMQWSRPVKTAITFMWKGQQITSDEIYNNLILRHMTGRESDNNAG